MSNALRNVIVAGIVGVGSMVFDGSIKPAAIIIAILAGAIVLLVGLLNWKKKH